MAVFPDIKAAYGSQIDPRWKTIISGYDTGSEQRIAKRQFAVFDFKLTFPSLSKADAQSIWNFYNARRGAYEAFYIFAPESDTYSGLFVAEGDGSRDVFDLPGKFTSGRTLYKNGAVQSSGFAYLTGTGQGGADQVDFTTAPAAGDIISIDMTCILRAKVRFKEDRLPKEFFDYLIYSYGIELVGLSGE